MALLRKLRRTDVFFEAVANPDEHPDMNLLSHGWLPLYALVVHPGTYAKKACCYTRVYLTSFVYHKNAFYCLEKLKKVYRHRHADLQVYLNVDKCRAAEVAVRRTACSTNSFPGRPSCNFTATTHQVARRAQPPRSTLRRISWHAIHVAKYYVSLSSIPQRCKHQNCVSRRTMQLAWYETPSGDTRPGNDHYSDATSAGLRDTSTQQEKWKRSSRHRCSVPSSQSARILY
eukprot:284818096_4